MISELNIIIVGNQVGNHGSGEIFFFLRRDSLNQNTNTLFVPHNINIGAISVTSNKEGEGGMQAVSSSARHGNFCISSTVYDPFRHD